MQFQQDWPKYKKYTTFTFLAENLEKFRSTELYGAPLEGSTIFLCRSPTCRMSMESYWLAELKYAISSRTGHKTIKLPRSKLFLWMVFKHGLLEGSTILLQYSAITRTPLESSIRRVRMWNFTRIGPRTKKLWFSIVPERRPSEQPGLGQLPKSCELQLFFVGNRQAIQRLKALHLRRLNIQFQQD